MRDDTLKCWNCNQKALCVFGDFYASGVQKAEVTKSLYTCCPESHPRAGGMREFSIWVAMSLVAPLVLVAQFVSIHLMKSGAVVLIKEIFPLQHTFYVTTTYANQEADKIR